ncbi:hypothetical protein BAE44_0019297, partial [Dichanthelium oligosanthes]
LEQEDQQHALDSIPKSVADEDLINKVDAILSRASEVKEYQEPSMEHTLLQVVTSAEDGTDVAFARRSITKDCVLPIINETVVTAMPLATTTIGCEQPKVTFLDMTIERVIEQVDTSFEDVVLVEDASDDEEVVSVMGMPIKDPILLITIEDNPSYSTLEVKAEVAQPTDDPSIEVVSSPASELGLATILDVLLYIPLHHCP